MLAPIPDDRRDPKRLPTMIVWRGGRSAYRLPVELVDRVTGSCATDMSRRRWSCKNIWSAPDARSRNTSGVERDCCHSSFRRFGNRSYSICVAAPHCAAVGSQLHSNTQPQVKTGPRPARLPAKPESSLPIGADQTSVKPYSLLRLNMPAPTIQISVGRQQAYKQNRPAFAGHL